MLKPAFTIILLALFARPSSSQDLWDMTEVRDFYFTFTQANWWTQLQKSDRAFGRIPQDGTKLFYLYTPTAEAPPGSAGAQLWCQAFNTDLSNALTIIIAP